MTYSDTTWQQTAVHAECGKQTPCYIFDGDILKAGVRQMKEALPHCGALCYAMKANPFLVGQINPVIDRFEVCSPGEYEICHREGIDPEKIIVSGVNKTEHSMARILELSGGKGVFTAESKQHYRILRSLCQQMGCRIRLLVRLSSGNQFGVDEQDLEEIFRLNQDCDCIEIIGVHYFSGTQKKLKKIEKELAYLDEYADKLKKTFGLDRLELEYGPGLSVSYFAGDKPMSRQGQLEDLENLLAGLQNFDFIGIEMGRFMAADCGCFMSSVDDVKTSDGLNYAIMDSGIHQLNYFGQMMGMKLPPIRQIPTREEAEEKEYTLAGALCTVNDILVRDIKLRGLEIGDRLLFQRCGAYSMTEGASLFLSRDLPAVYIYTEQEGYTCLRPGMEINYLNGKQPE